MPDRYRVQPVLWPNATIVVIGGGNSVRELDLAPLLDSGVPIVGVNNAYKLVRPDVLFFADSRWWRWNKDAVNLDYCGYRVVTASGANLDERLQRVRREYNIALAEQPNAVTGPDSGSMAINLAYHYGASRIILLGFDMRFTDGRAHWHEDYPVPTPESNYVELFAPTYPPMIQALADRGVEVIRSTPSALEFIPEVPLADALALPTRNTRNIIAG